MVLALDAQTQITQASHCFKRRELFPLSYSQLWRIETGLVRTLTWDTQGHVFVLGLWSTGDVVGPSLSDAEFYRIECLSSVTACLLSPSYHCHRSELLSYLRRTEQLLQIAQMRSVKDRLICFLDYLVHQFGQEVDQGIRLKFHLTHQDIADVINSSRVTVTRLMGDLHRQGKISWYRKRFLFMHL